MQINFCRELLTALMEKENKNKEPKALVKTKSADNSTNVTGTLDRIVTFFFEIYLKFRSNT
jgi:hypothetical protein